VKTTAERTQTRGGGWFGLGRRARILLLLLIVAAGLFVRLSYHQRVLGDAAIGALARHPSHDPRHYLELADVLRSNGWVGDRPFFMGPLYPYLLAVLQAATAPAVENVYAVQIVLGVINCVLVYLLGAGVGRRGAGLLGAALAALYSPFIFYENMAVMATVLSVLVLVFCNLAVRKLHNGGAWADLAMGLLLGLIATGRGTFLVLVPFTMGFMLWTRHGAKRGAALARGPAVFLAGVALPLLLVWSHNLARGDGRVLLTSNFGINLFVGNHEGSHGRWMTEFNWPTPGGNVPLVFGVGDFEREVHEFAEKQLGRSLRPSQVSAFYSRGARDFILRDPGAFVLLTAKKIWMTFNRVEIGQIASLSFFRERLGAWQLRLLPFGAVSLLAVLGVATLGLQDRRLLFLYGVVAAYALGMSLFFVTARYRLPTVGILILLAAGGMLEFARRLWSTRGRRMATLLPLVPVLLFAAVESRAVTTIPSWLWLKNLSVTMADLGDEEESFLLIHEALSQSHHERILRNFSYCYKQFGKQEEGLRLLESMLEQDARDVPVRAHVAKLLLKYGRHEEALTHSLRGIWHTGVSEFYVYGGYSLMKLGRFPEAFCLLKLGTQIYPADRKIKAELSDVLRAVIGTRGKDAAARLLRMDERLARARGRALVNQVAAMPIAAEAR